MKRSWRTHLLAVALLSASLVGTGAQAAATTSVSENVATRWVNQALLAVKGGSPAVLTGTPGAARTYAMTTAAMYDAVNGIDTAETPPGRGAAVVASYAEAPVGGNRDAAASAAAYEVLRTLFKDSAKVSAAVDAAHTEDMAKLGDDQSVEAGRAWGAAVGTMVLSLRANDGTERVESKPGGMGPGVFPRNFSGTQFRHMAPFGISSITPYATAGPPDLTSEEYADAFNEVKTLGSSTDVNAERTAIARHWLAEGGTVRETGLWFKAALNVVADQPTVNSLSDTVRLFALLGMGIADAVAVSWEDKYSVHYWRPGDAVRQASTDGNPATEEDPTWNPRNGAPCTSTNVASCTGFGGTPEHTSGTSTFAGAAAEVLASFYCTDRIGFTFQGEQLNSQPRSYSGFEQAAREAGRSRIYGGIHFQFSNEAGRDAGKSIGQEIVRTRLLGADADGGASGVCAPTSRAGAVR